MKLLKKLLPIATIASTALVVSPFVTSCSKGVTSFDWTPKYQKETTSIEISYDDLTNYASLSREYFEDKQNKYFMEDMMYTQMNEIQAQLQEYSKKTGYSDVTVSFVTNVSDLNLTQKNVKITTEKGEKDIYGYQISLKVSIDTTWNWKYSSSSTNEEISKIEDVVKQTVSAVAAAQDFYVCLIPNSNKFKYRVFAHSDFDWIWTTEEKIKRETQRTYYYKDGSNEKVDLVSGSEGKEVFTKKNPSTIGIVFEDSSYYLDKVTYTIKE